MESTTIDEPLTPNARLFMQPKSELSINCAVGFKNPVNAEAIKSAFINSFLLKHPRFSSLLVVNKKGEEFWRETQLNYDDHFIIHQPKNPNNSYNEEQIEERVNQILADFAYFSPLSMKKPLWEVHIISELKCFILRFHHALGDGTTVMSLFMASCKKCDDNKIEDLREKGVQKMREDNWRNKGFNKGILKRVWLSSVSALGFIKILCFGDKKTAISGGDGVEQWPRMVATAKFRLDDMKTVKRAIFGATINDVLFGVLSFGFSKYLALRSSDGLQYGLTITGVSIVNLRKQPGLQDIPKLEKDEFKRRSWGNKVGFILFPLYCQMKDTEPLNYILRAKKMMDIKKQSMEAHFTYSIGKLSMSLFGPKVAEKLFSKVLCNTTFLISNVVGPQEEMSFGGNPMTYIRPTTSSLPHAVTMIMTSYNGMANVQILVAKDIISDPQVLTKCFEDALLEMKNASI